MKTAKLIFRPSGKKIYMDYQLLSGKRICYTLVAAGDPKACNSSYLVYKGKGPFRLSGKISFIDAECTVKRWIGLPLSERLKIEQMNSNNNKHLPKIKDWEWVYNFGDKT